MGSCRWGQLQPSGSENVLDRSWRGQWVVFAFGDGVERVVEVAEHGLEGKPVIQQEVSLTGDLFVWKLDAEFHKVRGFSCVLVRGQNVVLDAY